MARPSKANPRRRGLTGRLRTIGFSKGVMGASRSWRWVWVALTVGGFVRRSLGRRAEVVYTEALPAGAVLEIRHSTVSRKAAAKADREARREAKRQAKRQAKGERRSAG